MIAPVLAPCAPEVHPHSSVHSASDADDSRFVTLLPAIRRYARHRLRHLRPAAREEALADVVAIAFVAYRRLVARRRHHLIYPTTLAHYAVLHVRAGRQVGGPQQTRDVLSPVAQRRRGFQVQAIEHFDRQDERWVETIVVEDRHATPAEVAAARLDTAAWLSTLPVRNRKVARVLATGETTMRAAERFGVTQGRISQLRDELRRSWEGFQGEAQTGCTPRPKIHRDAAPLARTAC